jgi:hypothetical protein
MPQLVYFLCAATSFLCALMLLRAYRRSRARLLLWTSAAFVGFAINNILLFLDLIVFVDGPDLSAFRAVSAVVAATVMLFGLIWETTS